VLLPIALNGLGEPKNDGFVVDCGPKMLIICRDKSPPRAESAPYGVPAVEIYG
jgi:hypothetical protein